MTDKRPCNQKSDCFNLLSKHEISCVMPEADNSTKLIRILHDQDKKPILYVGSIKELIYSSKAYIPKFNVILPKMFLKIFYSLLHLKL